MHDFRKNKHKMQTWLDKSDIKLDFNQHDWREQILGQGILVCSRCNVYKEHTDLTIECPIGNTRNDPPPEEPALS